MVEATDRSNLDRARVRDRSHAIKGRPRAWRVDHACASAADDNANRAKVRASSAR